MRRSLWKLVVVVGAVQASACGVRNDSSMTVADDRPFQQQVDEFLSASAGVVPALFTDVRHATPGTVFVVNGRPAGAASDLLVVGDVIGVRAGRSFSWPSGPQVGGLPPTRLEHQFNDPASDISTLVIEIRVSDQRPLDALDGTNGVVSAEVSLFAPIDVGALRRELLHREVVGLLLANGRTGFDLDPTHYGILGMGAYLGFLDASGRVTFGGLTDDATSDVVPLADLLNPVPTVVLEEHDGLYTIVGLGSPSP